jgi:hypothetical protein
MRRKLQVSWWDLLNFIISFDRAQLDVSSTLQTSNYHLFEEQVTPSNFFTEKRPSLMCNLPTFFGPIVLSKVYGEF